MPLKPGSSHEVISANIAELIKAGHEPKQAEAIAYKEAGQAKDDVTVAKIVAAGIMYVTPASRALWLRAADGNGFTPEWSFPGGKLEGDETAREAALREAAEEVGLAPVGVPLLLHQGVTARGVDYSTFLQVVTAEFTPQLSDEHDAYCWAPLDNPPQPVNPGITDMLGIVGGWVDKALDEAKTATDASPEGSEQITLTVIDPDGQLAKMLAHIKDTAAIGHSFDVVVDPGDKDYEKKFGIDGDGAFRIVDVKVGAKAEDEASLSANAALPVGKKAEDASYNMNSGGGSSAKREGAQARVDKKPRSSNPFREGTKERDHWFKGWDNQNKEVEKYSGGKDTGRSSANDSMALDRTLDDDGRLHVQSSHITRACVSEYWGREIPGYKENGLQPDVKYKLLRPADELSKPETVASLNNIPLLDKHVPVSADDHQPDRVIGSTGTDAKWNDPFLDNSLVIWARSAIEQVERGEKADLSAGYRYQYAPESGTFEGEAYDGRMVNIRFNHVAHVIAGRTPGATVGDEAIQEEQAMAAIELKQWDRIFGALDAKGGAEDATLDDLKAKVARAESDYNRAKSGERTGRSTPADTDAKEKIWKDLFNQYERAKRKLGGDAEAFGAGGKTVKVNIPAKGGGVVKVPKKDDDDDNWVYRPDGTRVRVNIPKRRAGDAMLPDDAGGFKKGDKVTDVRGNRTVVTSVNHPMVYTKNSPESSPGGGFHHTKLFKTRAKDAVLPDDDTAFQKIADAISGKDAAFSEPFVRDITAYINTLDLKGGSGNKQQIIDYVTNRKSFDAIALSDKFGCTVGTGKSIQDKMKELRQKHGEGVGSINKPVDKGEQRARQLRQQTGPRR